MKRVAAILVACLGTLFSANQADCDPTETAIDRGKDFPGLKEYLANTDEPLAIWRDYLARSESVRQADDASLKDEVAKAGIENGRPIKAPKGRGFRFDPRRGDEWYQTDEAATTIAAVLSYQVPNGGWCKANNYTLGPRPIGQAFGSEARYCSTFDNRATIPEIRLLCRAHRLLGTEETRAAAERGLRFILASQYPNGGWPQIWPLRGDYHDCVTFNDDAMTNIMGLLLDVSSGAEDYAWIDDSLRGELASAYTRALDCALEAQVERDGQLLGWAQQYEPIHMQPAPARAFEMTSLSTAESASIMEHLVRIENPDTRVVAAIEAAAAWLERIAIDGYSYDQESDGTRSLIPEAGAKRIWARFIDIASDRPLFGDRDQSVHLNVELISEERRNGYAWYTSNPESALKLYRKWKAGRDSADPRD